MNKIFIIGLPKTGQSSVTEACKILGYNAGKYPVNRLKIGFFLDWDFIREFDVLSDTPLTNKYKHLNKVYPTCKFIFLFREFESWLRSCKEWFKEGGKGDCKEYYELHKTIFGCHLFDKNKFEEVNIEYYHFIMKFINKSKLLKRRIIFDVCAGDGWKKLCNFLQVPIPEVEFPHLNKGEL